MSTQQIPDTLLATIEVPEGTGVMIHTFVCKIDENGELTLPTGYTDEQQAALIAYFTYNDEHLHMLRGARLRMMSECQQDLLDAAIETLKTPAQKLRERVETFVLEQHALQHILRGEHQKVWCSWFEEVDYAPRKQEWVNDGLLPSVDTPLYEVTISERPAHRPHASWQDTEYRVAHNQTTNDLTIIASWPATSDLPDEEGG